MVFGCIPGWIGLAHGNDPSNLAPVELFGQWSLAMVTLALTAGLGLLALRPVLHIEDPEASGPKRSEVAVWTAIALATLVATATWITRQSLLEAIAPPPPPPEHAHSVYHGGQISMWGDYHCEVARVVSGEYRIWMSDKYRRPIGSQYFSGTITARNSPRLPLGPPPPGDLGGTTRPPLGPPRSGELEESLDRDYRFVVLDRRVKSIQVFLRYPGNTIKLDIDFDSPKGRRSLKDWCGS